MALVTTKDIAGTEVEIHADGSGRWSVTMPGSEGARSLGFGQTLDGAVQQAAAKLRKGRVKVSVPFLTQALEEGVATGFHAGSGNLMTRIDGVSQQLATYKAKDMLRPDMPEERRLRLATVDQQLSALKRERAEIQQEFKFDVQLATEAAIAKAQEEADTDA